MAENQDGLRRSVQDYVQKLVMHGVSRQEVESGQGSHSVRVISPRSVLPYYVNLRRCKRTGRHSTKPGGCASCKERFLKTTEIIQISDGGASAALAESTRTDEEEAASLASPDWWTKE